MKIRQRLTRPRLPGRGRRRLRAAAAACVTVVLGLGYAQGTAAAQPAGRPDQPTRRDVPNVPVAAVPATKAAPPTLASATDAPAPVWPSAGAAETMLPTDSGQAAVTKPQHVGTLPVLVNRTSASKSAGRVRVQVYDRGSTAKAGVKGVLLRVAPGDAASPNEVSVTVNYNAFRTAYGGGWASRLRLSLLPECALLTPDKPTCAPRALPSSQNNAKSRQVTATVPLTALNTFGALLALDADPSGPAGDYTATALKPSSTWSAGGNSGAFTWSYPMRVPPVPGDVAPVVELGYNSQAIDGRHAAANNQPSWAGGGFELWPGGYIERRYRACDDDTGSGANNTQKTGDLCWATDNAVLNLNGSSSELIYNATEGRWHLRHEDGSHVERKYNADNGDDNGEHWVVTTTDGTQYWFGRQKLPGWSSGDPVTNSTWTAPVFGNHPNEFCYSPAGFPSSSCTQAWRWNLDYVVSLHGDTASYWYATETNKYARNKTQTDTPTYIRGGYLTQISYGTRQESGTDSVYAGAAAAKVVFGVDERCESGCTTHDLAHWPDTPWDQECLGSSCTVISPTFWSTKRLATVTTQVRGASGYDNVERWTFTHGFPDPGDTTHAALWLERISHQGLVGGTATVPDITFTGLSMDNRVDGIDDIDAMAWFRIVRIDTDTGGAVAVIYSDRDCSAGAAKPAVHNNNRLCYPVKWIPDGQSTAFTDWFHKYVVKEIREVDAVGGNPQVLHRYDYLGDPAWHYNDDDGIIKPSYKTWSEWRGYARVGVTVGDPNSGDARSYTESRFFRGMHGDKQPTGTRTVAVTDSQGGTWPDEDWFAGMTRESITFNGPNGPEVSGTINDPWASPATASRTINEDKVEARFVDTATVWNRTALDAGRGPRITKTTTTFDAYGMPIQVNDLGEDGVTGDEQCTKTTYEPRNTTTRLLTRVHRAQKFAVDCDSAGNVSSLTEADVISDTRTSFDGAPPGTAPDKGDPTKLETASAWNAGNPTYITTSQTTYDAHGRVEDVIDANNNLTRTSYTPETGGPVTATSTTNALGHVTTTTLAPAWGATVAVVDANDKRTDLTYDPLGRLSAVWKPGRTKNVDPANATYTYSLSRDTTSTVTVKTLAPNGNYLTTHTLYDGLLRQVQTQTASPEGGRILTNTFYDSAGREKETYGAYYNAQTLPASPSLAVPVEPLDIPTQNRTVFDGAGRPTATIFEPYNSERWRTTTYYAGDRIDVTPPAGGPASSTVTDARGRTTQLSQYPRLTQWDDGDITRYDYNRKGQLTAVTDPAGNTWTYGYDIRGNKTTETDPDRGTTTSTYDNGQRLSTTVDARNIKLVYRYDALNRKTAVYQNFALGTPRASWIYDTVAKGHLYSSVRHAGAGNNYEIRIPGYNNLYQPTSTQIVVPAVESGLAGTYEYQYTYHPNGAPATTSYIQSAGTDLPTETIHHQYTDLGQPSALTSTYGTTHLSYVHATHYDPLGRTSQYNLCTTQCDTPGHNTHITYNRELETGRTTQNIVTRDTAAPYTLADITYAYDHAGNITRIGDIAGAPDTQCFTYDHLRRLKRAWTPGNGDCDDSPTPSGLGGPAPYWHSWEYNTIGNRLEQTNHITTGDVKTSYTYPASGNPRPHAIDTVTTGSTSYKYEYDNIGNLTKRFANGAAQTLTWDPEGRLATTSDPSGSTSYIYDADGNRLVRRDSTGKTLYLAGQEVRYSSATSAKSVTRFYAHADTTVASRTAAALTWLISDHQGTNSVSVNASTNAVAQRHQTPFGGSRDAALSTWPHQRGFVGGNNDPTGLTHLGAREYDPADGRFISIDPIMDLTDPQQWNAYAYSNNNPTTFSDPSGEKYCEDVCGPGEDTEDSQGNYHEGSGSGGSGQSTANTTNNGGGSRNNDGNGDWTTRHNAARDEAVYWIQTRTGMVVYPEYRVPGGSYEKNGNDGAADIVAYDPINNVWYVWEVKHVGGTVGKPAGAEAKGPDQLDWYLSKLREAEPNKEWRKGFEIPHLIMRPDPINPKQTLVTTSSTFRGSPHPEYEGIVVYWVRNRDPADQFIREQDAARHERAEAAAAAEQPDDPSMLRRAWNWWIDTPNRSPYGPGLPIPGIRSPLRPGVGVR